MNILEFFLKLHTTHIRKIIYLFVIFYLYNQNVRNNYLLLIKLSTTLLSTFNIDIQVLRVVILLNCFNSMIRGWINSSHIIKIIIKILKSH